MIRRRRMMADVETVLGDIKADGLPQLVVFNKLDLVEQLPRIERNEAGTPTAVYCSAATGEGTALLLEAIRERLALAIGEEEIAIAPSRARLRSALYQLGAVSKEEWQADGSSTMHVRLPLADWHRLNV